VPGAAAPNFCWRRLSIFGGAPARRELYGGGGATHFRRRAEFFCCRQYCDSSDRPVSAFPVEFQII
jgi:hypothetical protein